MLFTRHSIQEWLSYIEKKPIQVPHILTQKEAWVGASLIMLRIPPAELTERFWSLGKT